MILLSLKVLKKSFSKISIFVTSNNFYKIIFFNYKEIIDFNDESINIDNIIFKGKSLSINKLEDSTIEIFGKIKSIETKKEE